MNLKVHFFLYMKQPCCDDGRIALAKQGVHRVFSWMTVVMYSFAGYNFLILPLFSFFVASCMMIFILINCFFLLIKENGIAPSNWVGRH